MSYGTKYQYQYVNGNGDTVSVQIQQDGYSGSVTSLAGTEGAITVVWGEEGSDNLTTPLNISRATLRFVGDTDAETMLDEVFDSPDTEYRVRLTVGGELEWQGFLASDLRRYNPYKGAEAVSLEAFDGLALLENTDAWTNDDGVHDQLTDILRETVRGLHDLPIWTSMDWHSHDADVTDGACPLDVYEVTEKAYKQLGEDGDVESSLDRRTQLEDILERFGLRLSLAEGAWHLRQRDQIGTDATVKRWKMGVGETSFGTASTDDVGATLPAAREADRPVSGVSRLRSVQSTYSYRNLGELVRAGSFESGDLIGWTEEGGTNAVVKYDDSPLSIESTQSDTWLLEMEYSFTQGEEQPKIHISQQVPALFHEAGPRAAYRFQWDEAREKGVAVINPVVDGTYVLDQTRVDVTDAAQPSVDGTLSIDELPGADETIIIPAGAELPIFESGTPSIVSWITLSKPALAGDTTLEGNISDDVPSDGEVRYYFWSSSTSNVGITGPRKPPGGTDSYRMDTQKIIVPQHTTQGEHVVGDMLLELGTRDTSDGDPKVWVDHVSVQLTIDGDPIEATTYVAVDDHYGREREIGHRTGAGPTASHPRRIFDPVGGEDLLTGWKPAPYSDGESSTGKGLEQLVAEQWMRQRRETLDRRAYDLVIRGETVSPIRVYQEDGSAYTAEYLRRTWSTAGDTARIELIELKDAGVSGLERGYAMESGTDAGGSSVGGTVITDQTVEGASTWSELTGKEDAVDDVTLGLNGSEEIFVKDLGIGTAQLASDAVTQSKIAADSVGSPEIAAAAVGPDQADTALAGDGLTGGGGSALAVDAPSIAGDGLQGGGSNDLAVDSTVARTDADETFDQDVTITGSLTVNGDEVVQNTQTVEVEDNLLFLNAGETGSGATRGTVGFEADRGTEPPVKLIFDESDDLGRFGVEYRTIQYSGLSGSFDLHEEIVGQSSGAKALIWYDDGAKVRTKGRTSTFSSGETIEGQTSGATATIDSISVYDQTQRLAALEDAPTDGAVSFWNAGAEHLASVPDLAWTGSVLDLDAPLEANDLVEHPQHVSKQQRWEIDSEGRADFRRLYTDELVAKTFTVDLTQALAGSDYLVKSVATLDAAFTVPAEASADGTIDGGTGTLTVRDNPGAKGVAPFAVDDWLRLRVVDNSDGGLTIVDAWVVVQSVTDNGDGTHSFGVQRGDAGSAATGKTIQTDAAVLDYGQSGQGLIRRTVEGPDAPFSAIRTWTSDPVQDGNYETRALTGNLDAAPTLPSGTDPSGYGLFGDNVFLSGHLEAESGAITGSMTVNDLVYIGDDISDNNSAYPLQIGTWKPGTGVPIVRVRNPAKLTQSVAMRVNDSSDWGLIGEDADDNRVFELGGTNQIAGWKFTNQRLLKDLSGVNTRLAIGEGSTLSSIFDPRDGFFAIDTNSGGWAGLSARDDADRFGVAIDNGKGDASDGRYISIGNDHFRSEDNFGMTIYIDGKTVLDVGDGGVTTDSIFTDSILANSATITGQLNAISSGNEFLIDPDTPANKFYEDGDLTAVITSETSPNYSPTKTDDVNDDNPNSTGSTTYSVSGDGIWLSLTAEVTNQNTQDSETIGVGAEDQNGTVLGTAEKTVSAGATTTVSMLVRAEGATEITVTRLNSSQSNDAIDFEIYKPLTVVSRLGVRLYKTPSQFTSLS